MSDFTEKNRQHFDKTASTYKGDFGKALETIHRQVQSRRSWVSDTWIDTPAGAGKDVKVLEYACGPGVVSMALAPFASKVIGLDVSDNMIQEYNNNAREAGFEGKMVGQKGDLLAESVSADLSGPEFSDFDVVVVSMALHHFEDVGLAMRRFSERLRKGGVCLIVDLVPEGDIFDSHGLGEEFKEARATVKTHGFAVEDMKKLYEEAGLGGGIDYQVIEEPLAFTKNGKAFQKTIFIARAQRI